MMVKAFLRNYLSITKNKTIKNVLICPDKFKFSLTAEELSKVISQCIPSNIQRRTILLGDGGEGSLDAIARKIKSKTIKCKVHDPLFRTIEAQYLCTENNEAYIEMAKASGLALLSKEERNPLLTTTLGTGDLILDSLMKGSKKINLLLGGSATNEGGIGCAQALGFCFYDKNDQKLLPIGENLKKIVKIKPPEDKYLQLVRGAQINVYTDVKNCLTGNNGASYVYGPQKGADEKSVKLLDQGLKNLDTLFRKNYGIDANKVCGSGAAGGLGAGCLAFFSSKLLRGIDLIFKLTNFESQLQWADLVITGQGKFDRQTLQGKVVKGVIDRSSQYKKPVLVLCAISENKQAGFSASNQIEVVELLDDQQKITIDPRITERKLREKLKNYFSHFH